jgi:hypothetical protein
MVLDFQNIEISGCPYDEFIVTEIPAQSNTGCILSYGNNGKLNKWSVDWCNAFDGDCESDMSCSFFDFDSTIVLLPIDKQESCLPVLPEVDNPTTLEPATAIILIIVFFVSIILFRFVRKR